MNAVKVVRPGGPGRKIVIRHHGHGGCHKKIIRRRKGIRPLG